jgi:hypothetical protein
MERFVKGDIVITPFLRKAGTITPELMNKAIDAIIFILKQ